MKPFVRSDFIPSQVQQAIEELLQSWINGHREIRKAFPNANTVEEARAAISAVLTDELDCEVYINDHYQVSKRNRALHQGEGYVIHLSIKRLDKKPIHDWRHFQEIKNMIVGPEHEAVEVYPAESRLVDGANQYHLWVCPDPNYRFPFGFAQRAVSTMPVGNSVQRPFGEEVPA